MAVPPECDDPMDGTVFVPATNECLSVEPPAAATVAATADTSVSPPLALLLFSGPLSNPHNLSHALQRIGIATDTYDVCNSSAQDLSDDAVWDPIERKLQEGKYACLFAPPPCNSFSRLRGLPAGPPAVRSPNGPERYGLRNLSPKDSEFVRLHNLLAIRAARAFRLMVDLHRPAVLEQPECRAGEISMLHLDEFVEVLNLARVEHLVAPQCRFGAKTAKPTSWVFHSVGLHDMPRCCDHSIRTWYRQGDAATVKSKHHPSKGTSRYYLCREQALKDDVPSSTFVSGQLAHYPELLAKFLAAKLKLAITLLLYVQSRLLHLIDPQTMSPKEKWFACGSN